LNRAGAPLVSNSLSLEIAAASIRDGFSCLYGLFGPGFAILDLALSTFSRLCDNRNGLVPEGSCSLFVGGEYLLGGQDLLPVACRVGGDLSSLGAAVTCSFEMVFDL
jgi:hypothetical protein